jgi:DNA-binding winged helix-turn-helix (wHTH) protein/TolB-like protein
VPASTREPARRVALGSRVLDRDTGELVDAAGGCTRLAPQPAALLGLLVDHAGEVVSRDAIRAALWPDVAVDFEAGLHQCIRQIRVALADDATFVETIPRRGYRLRREALGCVPNDAPPTEASAPSGAPRRRSFAHARIAVLLAVVVVAVAWWLTPVLPSRPCVAIMSFADPRGLSPQAESIGERVIVEIVEHYPAAIVVGPRTTEPLRGQGASIRDIARAVEGDWVLNANHSGTLDEPSMLVELIRVEDGEHVWVRRYRSLDDADAIADEIAAGTTAAIGSPSGE